MKALGMHQYNVYTAALKFLKAGAVNRRFCLQKGCWGPQQGAMAPNYSTGS